MTFVLVLKILFFYCKSSLDLCREGETERLSIHWLTALMAATAGDEQI